MSFIIAIETNFLIAGITPLPEQYLPLNLQKYKFRIHQIHSTLAIVSQLSYLSSIIWFTLYEAKSFDSYTDAVFFFVCTSLQLFFYINFAWNSAKIATILTNLKSTIEQSE